MTTPKPPRSSDPDRPGSARADTPLSQQDTIDLDPEPTRPWWWWIVDRNPMFLVSGVCMLAGCFLVSRHIHELGPKQVGGEGVVVWLLIALLAVLNVYEFAVIGLGLVLSKTKTLVRDTRHLLGLALLLVVDAGFVYTEIGIAQPGVGAAIAAVATVLAYGKAWLVLRSLGLWPTRSAAAVTAVSLGAMYALPVLVRVVASDGFVTEMQAFAVWAGVGLLTALYGLPLRWMRYAVRGSFDYRLLQRLVIGGLIVLPLVSLVGHASALLWVYDNTFHPAMLSPILLGLSAVVLRNRERLGGLTPAAKGAGLIITSAVVASLLPSRDLLLESEIYSWLAFTPLRGVLVLASAVLVWVWWLHEPNRRQPRVRGLVGALVPLAAGALGHTPAAMLSHVEWLYVWARDNGPRTKLEWGVSAIGLAFACLLIGGGLSWWRHTRDQRLDERGLVAGQVR